MTILILSTDAVYEEKKCLVKSGKDSRPKENFLSGGGNFSFARQKDFFRPEESPEMPI